LFEPALISFSTFANAILDDDAVKHAQAILLVIEVTGLEGQVPKRARETGYIQEELSGNVRNLTVQHVISMAPEERGKRRIYDRCTNRKHQY
jgi:ABC-type uncharacterized transport system ATPase component